MVGDRCAQTGGSQCAQEKEEAQVANHHGQLAAILFEGTQQLRPVILTIALLCSSGIAAAAELRERGKFQWEFEHKDFGGYSGLWIEPGGEALIAVSDKGSYIKADIERSNGSILDAKVTDIGRLPLTEGREPNDFLDDAEGLAVSPNGRIFVSYEGHHRVWEFSSFDRYAKWTHRWNFFWRFQPNSGLEALAIDAKGVVYGIPERSGQWTRPFPVFRYINGDWQEGLSISRSEKYLVVGADFGPDGRLYVLEREFYALRGFRSRIRRFNLGDTGFDDGETILQTDFGEIDNAEGLSLWQDKAGQTIVTLISDDNFNPFQNTLLVEYELVD